MQTNANMQCDLDTLTAPHRDYFVSVQKGDLKRFEEIVVDDFLYSNPDSSLLDKAEFLQLTVQPVGGRTSATSRPSTMTSPPSACRTPR